MPEDVIKRTVESMVQTATPKAGSEEKSGSTIETASIEPEKVETQLEKSSFSEKDATPRVSVPIAENPKKDSKHSSPKPTPKSPETPPVKKPQIILEKVSTASKETSENPKKSKNAVILRKSLRRDSPMRSPKPDSPRSPMMTGNGYENGENDRRRLRRRSQTPDEVASDDGKRFLIANSYFLIHALHHLS